MKVNLKMMYTTVTEDLFIRMEIIILVTGWMEKDQDMESWLISRVGCMKDNGSTASSWEINDILPYLSILEHLFNHQN